MKRVVIVVDIGNTRIAFALAQEGRIFRVGQLPTRGQERNSLRRRLATLAQGHDIRGSAVCSVVPAQTRFWLQELKRVTGSPPLQIHHRLKLGISIDYPRPAMIGADRLANACAAVERYGAPVIVADFGTALTFDIVSRRHAYLGGIIAPGLPLMTDYLADRTALLPRVDLAHDTKTSAASLRGSVIGKSTVQAMLIGARLGYRGMIREVLNRLKQALKAPRLRVCATGGYASWALAGSGLCVKIDPDLTLYGISRIYELNCPEDGS